MASVARGQARPKIEELASHMRPASSFPDAAAVVEPVESGVCIGLQRTLKRGEMPMQMFTSAIRRVIADN